MVGWERPLCKKLCECNCLCEESGVDRLPGNVRRGAETTPQHPNTRVRTLRKVREFSHRNKKTPTFNFASHTDSFLIDDSAVNGELFAIVPDKIFLFKTPSPLVPDGQDWVNKDGVRHFSPSFYADLFDFLGVRVVVQLDDRAPSYDAAAFERRGVAVCGPEDLGCATPAARFSLQTAGRFADVVRQAGGPVAVHCDDRLAATLIAMHLVRAGLFADPAEAVAWIAIAGGGPRPGLQPARADPRRRLDLRAAARAAAAAGPQPGGPRRGTAVTRRGEGESAFRRARRAVRALRLLR